MRVTEIHELVKTTGDPAFATSPEGVVVVWNEPCEALFGVPAARAVGHACRDVVRGVDERGPVCAPGCCVTAAVSERRPIGNFDVQVRTPTGMLWCNVSILQVGGGGADIPWAVHIVRKIDVRKRLELLMRDFVVSTSGISAEDVPKMFACARPPPQIALTRQELVILRLMGKGKSTTVIAAELSISGATVNNHVQHLMRKLDAHTRLEAVRRAQLAGLL